MIVRRTDRGLLCITQPDHAHLSRRVMERAVALREHPRRASVLLAIGEHDNGWTEPDAAPTLNPETGRPYDFVHAPVETRHEVWPRGIRRLSGDPWAAALVATHAITVYDHYRTDAAWDAFFLRMEALRDEMLRTPGERMEDLLADYVWVRLGDLLSLVFCTGWTEPLTFGDWTVTGSGSTVVATPDPFGGESVPLEVEARLLPDRAYPSDADLRDAFASAEPVRLNGEIRASGLSSAEEDARMAGRDSLKAPVTGAERREVGGVLMDIARVGNGRVKRVVYQPGFRWSRDMKPIVGTDLCMHAHVGFLVSGAIEIRYPDGCTVQFVAPQPVEIPPGHDGSVVGTEAAVLIEFDFEGDTVERFGLPSSHEHD